MRIPMKSLWMLTLTLIVPATGTSAATAARGSAADVVVVRPGVVVNRDRGIVYLMHPRGGIEAVEISSGRSVWYTKDAAQPLHAAGDVLIALADRSRAEADDPAALPRLDVVVLNTRDGRRQRSTRVSLPDRLWSALDDGPGRSLKVAATLEQGSVVLSWLVEEVPMTGVAPGDGVGAGSGRAPLLAATKASGTIRLDLASGVAAPVATDMASVETVTRPAAAEASWLPNVVGVQYLSADRRHVLVSELIGDDSVWEKYRWTIHSLDGARVGELRSPFPQAPFLVAGTRILFESRPFARRVDGRMLREPLKVRVVDLASAADVWALPLRDTTFYGPFPESEWFEGSEETFAPAPAPLVTLEAFGGDWRAIGPAPKRENNSIDPPIREMVGAIQAIAPHPTDANILYIGAVNGGVWKTTNALNNRPTWVQLTDTQASLSVGAMDLDPLDTTGQTLVVGIGRFSSFGRRGGPRSGLLRTTNGGTTWAAVNGGGVLTGKNICGVAVRGTRIVVAVNAADTAGANQLGIFRSTDAGVTFTQISSGNGSATGLPAGMTNDVVRDPANSSRLFTGVVADAASGGQSGVYRSVDGGITWTRVSNAAMNALISAATNNMEFAAGLNNLVYALIVNSGRLAGLFRSADGGTTWTSMDVPAANPGGQGSLHCSEAVDPTSATIVYVGGDTMMFRCNAALASGSQCVNLKGPGTLNNTNPHGDSREMVFDAAGRLLESDDGGIFRRTSPRDSQGDWFAIDNNIQAMEEHSMAYDSNSDVAMGGFQDTGTAREAVPDGIIWDTIGGGDGGDVAAEAISSPGLSNRYTSSQNLGGFRRQVVNASNVVQSEVSPALTVVSGANPTFQFTTPMRINAVDGRRLVIGATNGVYESLDQGATIRQLTPAVSVNGSGGHPLAYGATGNANIVYVGSADTIRVRTAAFPASLVQSTTYPGTGTGRAVVDLALDPTDPNTLFVVDASTVYVTQNAGASWTDITGNLPSLGPGQLRSVAHVQNASGEAVAVGTNNGVFAALSSSGFQSWSPMGNGLPHALVFDLDYSRADDKLVAGMLGRGTWALAKPTFSTPTTIFSSTFDANTDGFTFVDDAFGTNQPAYATGSFVNPGGFQGGGLRAVVGGVDDADILNMSGGWRRSFTLSSAQRLTLRFDFNLTQTSEYEADETSDMLSQVDAAAAMVQAHLVGNGAGGPPLSTGPVSRILDLGCVAAGSHTVTLGARNNKKTTADESTTLLLDNVSVTSSGACP
jgi:hypothetical protein